MSISPLPEMQITEFCSLEEIQKIITQELCGLKTLVFEERRQVPQTYS